MQKLLQDLYNGRINPLDMKLKDGSHYKKVIEEVSQRDDELSDLLTGKEKELFEKFKSKQGEQSYLNSESRFIQGFKMGARLVIEIICDNDGKLTDKNS